MHKYHINIVVSGGSYIIRGGREGPCFAPGPPGGGSMFAGPGSIDFDNIRESKLQIGSEKIHRLQPLTRFAEE